jgi:hypothetical protein
LLGARGFGYSASVQRREHARYKLWFPVQLRIGGVGAAAKVGINHNIGSGGMLVAACADVTVGERVTVTFQLPTGGGLKELPGSVVRIERNTDDPDGEWPFKVAVAFDEVSPDLIPYLEDAVARFGA